MSPAWSYPHTFHDQVNEVASGTQVNDNFNTAREKIEALEAAGASYGATGAIVFGVPHLISNTAPALLSGWLQDEPVPPIVWAQLFIGGKEATRYGRGFGTTYANFVPWGAFLVPAGVSWEWSVKSGTFTGTYTTMLL